MKRKTGELLLFGAAAVLLYPLLHEAGHCCAAVLIGGEAKALTLLPQPSVLCRSPGNDPAAGCWIALGGPLLPYCWSVLREPHGFRRWAVNLFLRGISIWAWIFGAAAAVSFGLGRPVPEEDLTRVLECRPEAWPVCAGVMALLAWIGCRAMAASDPMVRFCAFYRE